MQLKRKHIKILLLFLSIAMVCIWCYAIYLMYYTYKFISIVGDIDIEPNDIVRGPAIVTSPDKYKDIREEWSERENNLINHFPLEIPKNAKNVKMRGFLQGGDFFQVRFQLPTNEIALLFEKYKNESKASYVGRASPYGFSYGGDKYNYYGGEKFTLVDNTKNGLAGTTFRTSDEGEYGFSDDYTIFIIDAEPYKRSDWNHGYSRGVVISKDKNDIIYYAEDW